MGVARKAKHAAQLLGGSCYEQRSAASADLPKALVIENSSFLLSRHREVFRELRSRLQACGYEVRAKVMNTKHNGLPQDRERAYIVALRIVEGRDFRFPVCLGETVPLKHILQQKSKIVSSRPLASATNRRNLKTAIRQAKQKGYDPEVQNIFVDLDASERFAHWAHNLCPCITRPGCFSWVLHHFQKAAALHRGDAEAPGHPP